MDKRFERFNREQRQTAAALEAARNPRAVFERTFEGRYFRIGNEYTNAVWGRTGTFNEINDDLTNAEMCGNSGNAVGIIEVNEEGNPIKPPLPC